jgi:hypothetical protein
MMKSSAFPVLDGLVDLACRDGVEIRPTLLRVLTDLYVQKPVHSAEEEAQYVELALRLLDAVDSPTRAAVASRLSKYAAAPTVILRRLIEIAARPNAVAPVTARPQADRISEHRNFEDNTSLHKTSANEPLAVREPDLADQFFSASAEERRLILANFDLAGPDVAAPPRRGVAAESEVLRRLETAALHHNPGEFARILERALNIALPLAEGIARDDSGEPILVAVKALGMPAAVLQRVLLMLNPAVGQSIERVYELARLYDEMPPASAERMLDIWRQAKGHARPVEPPVHAPVTWDDERRSARAAATPTRHRVPARGEASPRMRARER